MRRLAFLVAALLGPTLPAAAPGSLPFARVDPGAAVAVFYRIEDGWQFVFACSMPDRRLVALEIDRREEVRDRDGDDDAEEAGEVVHHLPISKFRGQIQYIALDRLPLPRTRLLACRTPHTVVLGAELRASSLDRDHWLGLERDLAP